MALAVAPAWRGVGLGASLLRLFAQAASALGIQYLSATYPTENLAASRMLAANRPARLRGHRDSHDCAAARWPRCRRASRP